MKKKKLSVTGSGTKNSEVKSSEVKSSEVKGSGIKCTGKVRNPVAANPLLGKAARHKTRKSRQGDSRAQTRQSMKKVARGSDDWQNSSNKNAVAVLPVIKTLDVDLHNVSFCTLPVLAPVHSQATPLSSPSLLSVAAGL